MGIKEAESKYLAKAKRRRGLQKTRFYCQICERQALDENGFKCHVKSELHMNNVKKKLEDNGGNTQKVVDEYGEKLEADFLRLLRISHGEKLISLNKFYQEYISSKDHVHLNSTRWKTVTGFAHHLAKKGKIQLVGSSDGDGDNTAFRIAFVREKKGPSCGGVVVSDMVSQGGVDEEIVMVEMDSELTGTRGSDREDTFLSRQLAQLTETAEVAEADAKTAETAETAEKDAKHTVALASRGKVAFTLKKGKGKGKPQAKPRGKVVGR